MAKTLSIQEKDTQTPLEISVNTRRLAPPLFNVDPSAISLTTAEITDYFYTETECDTLFVPKTALGITGDVTCDGSTLHFTNGILTSIT